MNELTDTKGALCARDNECETLRVQSARQSALIISLQQRMQATETREKNLQVILIHFLLHSRFDKNSFVGTQRANLPHPSTRETMLGG